MALTNLDDDEKGISEVGTHGGPQKMALSSEAGLYSLIFRSNKPGTKKFKRWVTHEVLPAIRKTGKYEVKPRTKLDAIEASALAVVDCIRQIREAERVAEEARVKADAALAGIEQERGKVNGFDVLEEAGFIGDFYNLCVELFGLPTSPLPDTEDE